MKAGGRRWSRLAGAAAACAVLGAAVYANNTHGRFVYDDNVAIVRNGVVNGAVPMSLEALLKHDFWGDPMDSEDSHKSWRPLTTLSFYLNRVQAGGLDDDHTLVFHGTNIAFHALCSALSVVTCYLVLVVGVVLGEGGVAPTGHGNGLGPAEEEFKPVRTAFLCGLLFAVHPIHTEAVNNIVCRADILMSFFFLLGFTGYCCLASWGSVVLSGAWVIFFTVASVLCKETGVVLPLVCAVHDLAGALVLVRPQTSQPPRPTQKHKHKHKLKQEQRQHHAAPSETRAVALRTVVLLCIAVGVALWRLSMNHGQPALFTWNSNRAALQPATTTQRWLSIAWLWAHYVYTLVVPYPLCCDWSGGSIRTLTSAVEWRAWVVYATATASCGFAVASVLALWKHGEGGGSGHDEDAQQQKTQESSARRRPPRPRRMHGTALWVMALTFCVVPSLLSSNLLVTVGTSKAERLMYLPSLGACMAGAGALASTSPAAGIGIAGAYAFHTWQRNEAWLGPIRLLEATTRTVPTNSHSALALVCNIGQVGFLDRTYDALDQVHRHIDSADVGEGRVSVRLGNMLRVFGFRDSAARLAEREVAQLALMQDWRKNGEAPPQLALPSADEARELTAELRALELASRPGECDVSQHEVLAVLRAVMEHPRSWILKYLTSELELRCRRRAEACAMASAALSSACWKGEGGYTSARGGGGAAPAHDGGPGNRETAVRWVAGAMADVLRFMRAAC